MFKSVQTKTEINTGTEGAGRNREGDNCCGQKWQYRPGLGYRVGVRAGECGQKAPRNRDRNPAVLSTNSDFLTSPGSHLSQTGLRKI